MKRMFIVALFVLGRVAAAEAQDVYDLIIRGGRIVDGAGNPWYRADVGIRDGRIQSIGDLSDASAAEIIDAKDRVVCPGFIDIHSHADRGLSDPELKYNQPFLYQGITLSMLGIDGTGSDDVVAASAPYVSQGIGTNVAFYVGHNRARRTVMGIDDRAPTPEELDQMKAFIRRGMESGAFGISTGLEYIPGRYSETEEVIELSKVAASYGGMYDTHYRDEFFDVVESIKEGIEICEQAGLPVHFAHYKVIGEHNWHLMDETLSLINDARSRGLDITGDQYPWNNGAVSTLWGHIQVPPDLTDLFALWRKTMDPRVPDDVRDKNLDVYLEALREALRDPVSRMELRRATEAGLEGPEFNNWINHWGYDWFRVLRTKKHPEYLGQTINQIAYWKATTGFDLVADLIIEEGMDLGVSMGPFSPENVKKAMIQPWMCFSTDGTLEPLGEGFPHPRSYGSYARVIEHYVRELGLLSLEEAIRKATSLPAQILGLRDRGMVREGSWADLLVFDPENVHNPSTFPDPHHYAEGFDVVMVNGQIVLKDGKLTGANPGMVLRHGKPALGPGPSRGTDGL